MGLESVDTVKRQVIPKEETQLTEEGKQAQIEKLTRNLFGDPSSKDGKSINAILQDLDSLLKLGVQSIELYREGDGQKEVVSVSGLRGKLNALKVSFENSNTPVSLLQDSYINTPLILKGLLGAMEITGSRTVLGFPGLRKCIMDYVLSPKFLEDFGNNQK